METGFSTPLFSCFSDMKICCFGMWCPICLNALNWANIQNEKCSFWHCFYRTSSFWVRQHIKSRYAIEENYVGDCIITIFCYQCALCQDARELKNRALFLDPNKT